MNCESVYVGETSRMFGTRLSEHKKEVDKTGHNRKFTRSEKEKGSKTVHKSAIVDHTVGSNHIIDWEGAAVIARESQWRSRQVREAKYGSEEHQRTGTETRGPKNFQTSLI